MRTAKINRQTKETNVLVDIDLDGCGQYAINTKIGFFDHMLTAFCVHSNINLQIDVQGDLEVDCHHTIEDTAIVLGNAIKQALDKNLQIARYGSAFVPMDEALGFCSMDISNRPFLVFDCEFKSDKIGDFDTQMVEEFFRALAFNAGITLHIRCEYGKNDHHKAEALFKAFAHAFGMAIQVRDKLLSTKGML